MQTALGGGYGDEGRADADRALVADIPSVRQRTLGVGDERLGVRCGLLRGHTSTRGTVGASVMGMNLTSG
jgi:hypothetical protein